MKTNRNGKIGVGIIGLSAESGWAGMAHIPALRALSGYEIRALSASSQVSAEAAAKKYDIPLFFDNATDLVHRPEIELAIVSVKVPEHRELVKTVLMAGKMVYCEWPLARNLSEAKALSDLARERNIPSFIGLQARAVPAVRFLRDLILEDYVGEVLSTSVIGSTGTWGGTVEPRSLYQMDINNGTHVLSLSYSHMVDGLIWCLGNFKELSATLANRRPQLRRADTGEPVVKTSHDQVAVTGILENGAVVSIHYRAGLSRGTNFLWEINGTKGDLVITSEQGNLQFGQIKIHGATGSEKGLTELSVPPKYQILSIPPGNIYYPIAQNYSDLLSDIDNGTHIVPTFEDAVKRHQMIEAIETAARTGKRQNM